MINIQRLLCTVIKFHVVKEAKGEDFQVNFWKLNVLFIFFNRLQYVFQGRNAILL